MMPFMRGDRDNGGEPLLPILVLIVVIMMMMVTELNAVYLNEKEIII